jgi:hypothetical protein
MKWFKTNNRDQTVTVSMPEGYKFEFVTTALNHPSEDLFFNITHVAVLQWSLFFNNEHIDTGTHKISMGEKRPDIEMFLLGRGRALGHAKTVADARSFQFSDLNVVYELPTSMEVTPKQLAAHRF